MTMHLPDCEMGKRQPADHPHRWSGWPGAWCLDCGEEDATELCIGGVCPCQCHAQFWAEYDCTAALAKEGE